MKKLLVVGGKFSDIPSIKAAQELGYYVITTGNNPDDLGHQYSNKTILEDYSDKKAMLKLAKSLNIDALLPSCDDVSALSTAYISEHLSLGNFDNLATAKIIHHKDLYRNFAHQNSIDSPFALGFSSTKEAFEGVKKYFKNKKIIIKPVDMATGKGISIAQNENEAKDSIHKAFETSRQKRIVIEEFIEGSKHGFSTILYKQKVIFYFCDNEQYDYNPYAVSGTTTTEDITPKMAQKLIKDIEKIAKILNLKDGIFHTQTIARTSENGEKELVIIEACRRGGGDLYVQFVSMATNFNYPRLFIQAFNSLDLSPIVTKPRKFFARQCVMSKQIGTLEEIIFNDSLKDNILEEFLWHKKGEVIADTKTYKAGIVFLEFHSKEEMQDKINHLDEHITLKINNGGGGITKSLVFANQPNYLPSFNLAFNLSNLDFSHRLAV